jgi:predicted NBD/HSP70 family sugar kinase
MNRRRVLLTTLRSEPTTRSALSRATGISQPTTGKIVDELLADGILRNSIEQSDEVVGPGRPGQFLRVDDAQPRFLAIQLGLVHTRIAPLTVAPPARDTWTRVLETPRSMDRWARAIADAVKSMGDSRFSAVLVSVPGVVDEETGTSLLSPNARWMEGESVTAALGEVLRLPVHPIQEVQCLALGHRMADPTADNYLLVNFGIGIGCAAVVRGSLVRGPFPYTGEMGHTPVSGNLRLCSCGGIGCLETLVGRRYLFSETDDMPETALGQDGTKILDGQRAMQLRGALEAAGLGVAAALNVMGLKHAVVTGFVSDLPPEDFDVLRRSIAASAIASRFGSVRTEAAPRHWLAGLASVGIDRVIAPP